MNNIRNTDIIYLFEMSRNNIAVAVVKTFETGPMRPLSKVFFSTLFINSYLQDLPCNFLQIGRAFAISASCADGVVTEF